MEQEVKDYLAKRAQAKAEAAGAARAEDLIARGLCRREYAPEEGGGEVDYPKFDNEGNRRYRELALEVTDEEYAEICRGDEHVGKSKNLVVQILLILALTIYGIGILFCLSIAEQQGLLAVLSTFVNFAVNGSLILGFSELLRLQDKMSRK